MRRIDAHFHIWRQADLPWLIGPTQLRLFGPHEPIHRDDPISESLAHGSATGSIHAITPRLDRLGDGSEPEAIAHGITDFAEGAWAT